MNELIRRHRDILSFIFNAEGFINGNVLARMCGVSIRTIQLDIKVINSILKKYGIKISSVVIKGYYLDDKSKEVLKEKSIIRNVIDNEYVNETPNTPFERQMYILMRLTIKNYISIGELADGLYVSESSINKDIVSASAWLKENLKIVMDYSLHKGIGLNVSEKDKRNMISWVLSNKLNVSIIEKHLKYIFDSIDFFTVKNTIHSIIEVEANQFGYFLSGHSLQLFALEICCASARSAAGFKLEVTCETENGLKPIIVSLRKNLEENVNIWLTTNDWLVLQECFLSKQFLSGTNIDNIATEESTIIVEEFLLTLRNKYHIHLAEISWFREQLILYTAPMINRLKYNHCIGNKFNENIDHIHPLEYKMASEISAIVMNQMNRSIPAVEIGYIAVHLAAINKMWSKKLNTIIVSDYDESILSYIKNRIVSQIDDQIKVIGCLDFYQIITGKLDEYTDVDIILTTSTLAGRTNIPFIQINPIMNQKDIDNLLNSIKSLRQKLK